MKDKIKGLLTKKKLFRFFKIALIVIFTLILCQEKVQIKNDFFPSCQHT